MQKFKMMKKFKIIFKILIFFTASLITVFLFPESNKFSYEFQKGEPWKHKSLIAEYDFSVYKSKDIIEQEKDSILENVKPYFKFKEDVSIKKTELFNSEFDILIEKLTSGLSDDNLIANIQQNSNVIKQKIINKLTSIYRKGIIEPITAEEIVNKKDLKIYIVKNNVAELHDYDKLFSQKKAYFELNSLYSELIKNANFPMPEIDFSKYVEYNVLYDNQMSQKTKEQLLNDISPVRGMIQAGERIIYQGQLINDDKFQILTSLKKQYLSEQDSYSDRAIVFVGQFILVAAIFSILFLYLYFYNSKIFYHNRKLLYFPFLTILIIISSAAVSKYEILDLYLVPVTILPLITATFYKPRTAFLHHIVTILLIGYIAANGFEYIFIQFIAGFVAISGVSRLNRRSQILWTAALIFITYFILFSAITTIQEGDINKIDFTKIAWFAGSSVLVLIAYPLIFFFEKVFGFLSDVTLIELSDTNRPLLKLLAEKAPGTFQHTVQVANISEEAAREIGANPLLVRAGAMYHDIGKMNNPSFFIENQHSENPHDKISPLKSAEIIKKHVTDGVKMAKKYALPKEVADFITTHHGNSKIAWFLYKYKELNKDEEIDETLFQHKGILPYSKETAIVMIVDSVEAASRSLPEYTDKTIDDLIEKIVTGKISENLLIEADITFAEINKVKKLLKTKLKNIYHTRVVYPE
ncbi:MAG: HDIG domain-containing protein [Bacteroidales bacterium]|nr:HDIG domain-containing protein [Bacteroidales bacterium]